MEFLKKLFGLAQDDNDFIGLSSFQNGKKCLEDEMPVKKETRKEPTLTELLKRAN